MTAEEKLSNFLCLRSMKALYKVVVAESRDPKLFFFIAIQSSRILWSNSVNLF
jgi:hypothetical protein